MDERITPPSAPAESAPSDDAGLSRRSLLKTGAFAAAAAGTIVGTREALAQASTPASPGINRGAVSGMQFRALVRWGTGTQIVDAKLRELQPTQVLVRTKACCGCYTIGPTILGTNDVMNPSVPNHSTMGIVEAIGSQVRRVQVGDRVLVSGTSYCGHCYQCLIGEPSRCNYLGSNSGIPFADTVSDNVPIMQQSGVGGVAEYSTATEEYCIPIFSDLPDDEVAVLGDTFAGGYLTAKVYYPLRGGEDVVIFGAGPVGLGAIQGARASNAGQIIVVEPVPYRQDAARAMGATTIIDPNTYGVPENLNDDPLVNDIRAMCNGPTDRIAAGGRNQRGNQIGANLVVDASGRENFPPTVVSGPDPTGILPLTQAYNVTAYGGHFIPLAVQTGNFAVPGSTLSLKSMHTHGGQMAGINALRDTHHMVKMAEIGAIDLASFITMRVPLERAVEGWQAVADRTTLGMVVVFPD